MKRVLSLTLITFLFIVGVYSQSPQQFKYQAILRNASGEIISNQNVEITISLLSSDLITYVFTEQHSVTTSTYGLVNLNIGSIEDLSTVDFSSDNYFIEVSVDGTVMGTSQLLSVPYALSSKTVETVDYSVINNAPIIPEDLSDLSDTTNILFDGDYNSLTNRPDLFDGDWNSLSNTPTTIEGYGITNAFDGDYNSLSNKPTSISDFNLDANNQNITNVAEPVDSSDAATKAYVDVLEDRLFELEVLMGVANVVDIDGNVYPIVQIGNQFWMAENLRVTHFPDGTIIPNVPDNTDWANLNTNYGLSYYNNDSASYSQTYGAYYTWETAMYGEASSTSNPSGVQGVCPDGWHLPNTSEWTELRDFIASDGYPGEEGTTLKSLSGWSSAATDIYGFNAPPAGYRNSTGTFSTPGSMIIYWGTHEYNATSSYNYRIYGATTLAWTYSDNGHGFYVRCVKD